MRELTEQLQALHTGAAVGERSKERRQRNEDVENGTAYREHAHDEAWPPTAAPIVVQRDEEGEGRRVVEEVVDDGADPRRVQLTKTKVE